MAHTPIVAIDGPSGVGKGTVARRVAASLGYRHVDTGAMYRAVAWAAVHDGIPLDAEDRVAQLAGDAAIRVSDELTEINGHDVTHAIRTPEIDRAASFVARLPRVRAILVQRQRALGAGGGIVMEGRDIGTVVFPGADVKIYLDAAPGERARRRAADPAHAGNGTLPLSEVATELEARDRADKTRQSSPLMPAADAHVIDTTGLSIEQVTARVLEIVGSRLQAPGSSDG
jgi:cytidylate kinase